MRFVKSPVIENVFKKKTPTLQIDFAEPISSAFQIYLKIARERDIRSDIQIQKPRDVDKYKRAVS